MRNFSVDLLIGSGNLPFGSIFQKQSCRFYQRLSFILPLGASFLHLLWMAISPSGKWAHFQNLRYTNRSPRTLLPFSNKREDSIWMRVKLLFLAKKEKSSNPFLPGIRFSFSIFFLLPHIGLRVCPVSWKAFFQYLGEQLEGWVFPFFRFFPVQFLINISREGAPKKWRILAFFGPVNIFIII